MMTNECAMGGAHEWSPGAERVANGERVFTQACMKGCYSICRVFRGPPREAQPHD